MNSTSADRVTAYIFLFLVFGGLGCFFSWIGLGGLSATGNMALQWYEMQSWKEVPARIRSVEWVEQESRDSENNVQHRYEVKSDFDYEYGGQAYHGNRVDPYPQPDPFRAYHSSIYDTLTNRKESGQPFRCYVNPGRPAEAALFREMHWKWFFLNFWAPAAFCFFGFGALYLAWMCLVLLVRGDRKEPIETPLPIPRPYEEGCWESSGRKKQRGAILLAVIVNVFAIPGAVTCLDEFHRLESGRIFGIIVLVSLIVGSILFAVNRVRQARRFGDSVLALSAGHGVIGETMNGLLYIPAVVPPETPFYITFCCKEISHDSDSSSTTVLWEIQDTSTARVIHIPTPHTVVPVRLPIPAHLPPTSSSHHSDGNVWQLTVKADLEGPDYRADFTVNVLNTKARLIRPEIEEILLAIGKTSPSRVV